MFSEIDKHREGLRGRGTPLFAGRVAFTLVELLVVIAVISILLGLLLPAVQAAREAARRSSCTNNMKQQGLALHNYASQFRSFPAGGHMHDEDEGNPSISWRVMLLPFLELNEIYDEIDPQPHGGPENTDPEVQIFDIYYCPSAEAPVSGGGVKFMSNYSGVTGAQPRGELREVDFFDLEDKICGDLFRNGVLYPGSMTRIAEISDGTSQTLAIGERTYLFPVDGTWITGVTWNSEAPRICSGAAKNIRLPINPNHEDPNIGYFKGDSRADPPLRKILGNDLPFASEHSGGAQFTFADGSVQFIQNAIDVTILWDLATMNGNEVNRWEQ